jgi:Mannose-6-phosphate isomerase
MEPIITRKGKAKILIEGEEFTQVYASTDKIIFAISSLQPGQRACLDKGHKGSDEICYVINGKIVMHLPGLKEFYLLNEGDSILIPPGESHYAINVGDKEAITAWSCAPSL